MIHCKASSNLQNLKKYNNLDRSYEEEHSTVQCVVQPMSTTLLQTTCTMHVQEVTRQIRSMEFAVYCIMKYMEVLDHKS